MKRAAFVTGLAVTALLAVWPDARTSGRVAEQARPPAWQYGSVEPLQPDARGWGWQAKAYVDSATPRPFYNLAKERLFQDQQITSYTISSFNPELYCEVSLHFDYVWFELQHSTMSYDDVRRMIQACPLIGAAPMLRLADALESSIQRATDLGALGIIVPTVDDALEARDAARFSRYPPFGRRSAGGGAHRQIWSDPAAYRATINDNMLVVVMIETLEGVANADEIAAVHGVDVVMIGNNDLSNFSGWAQTDPRYQDAVTTVHNATLKAGKYFANAGAQYLTGHRLSPSTRMIQNGPARDGWTPAARGRGAAPSSTPPTQKPPAPTHGGDEEPVIGMPGPAQPGGRGGR